MDIGIVASECCNKTMPGGKQWHHIREFVASYYEFLRRFRIKAPVETADLLHQATGNLDQPPLNVLSIGTHSRGLLKLASLVAQGEINRVLFFQDPRDL